MPHRGRTQRKEVRVFNPLGFVASALNPTIASGGKECTCECQCGSWAGGGSGSPACKCECASKAGNGGGAGGPEEQM